MTAKQFLLAHGQCADNVDVESSLAEFWRQMRDGLAGKGGLPMIPTYLNVQRSNITVGDKRIVVDAGGTNFRSALAAFDDQGHAVVERISKTRMPASDRPLSKEQFYAQIAENIRPLLPFADKIGFCFSYPVQMEPDVDGIVQPFTKEIRAPQVVGTRVGAETAAACKQLDGRSRRCVILNDTVATLLGGMAASPKRYSAYLGYIYGTGTNVCYIESARNITKVSGWGAESMLINTECGSFNGFVRGDFDCRAIARTAQPSRQLFEKMTSGKYLAGIISEALCAAAEEGLFAGEVKFAPFELKDVSEFLQGGSLGVTFAESADAAFAADICRESVRRAAKLGAIVNAALAIATASDKTLPVCIVAEGTTFNRLPGYRTCFEEYLAQILGSRGLGYEIVQGEELNLVGALMATMAIEQEAK